MTMMIVLVALIILCTCNVAMIGLLVMKFCSDTERPSKRQAAEQPSAPAQDSSPLPYTQPPMSEEDLRLARQKFNAEMEAFQELMNYNQDAAYGIKRSEE